MKMKGLDLFSGIGGIALALEPYVQTVAYCEIDKYCQKVLAKRMEQGLLDQAPIFNDVTVLNGSDLHEKIDIISGGFPCQDISVAGNGIGLEGERSKLFFEIARLAGELRPTFIFLENVPAITSKGGNAVIGKLTSLGYDCRWGIVSAQSVGAWHRRERWWCLASIIPDTSSQRLETEQAHPEPTKKGFPLFGNCNTLTPHTESVRLEAEQAHTKRAEQELPFFRNGNPFTPHTESERLEWGEVPDDTWNESTDLESRYKGWSQAIEHLRLWTFEPSVGRVADGISNRVDRLKALGNAVVPLQARIAFEVLSGLRDIK